MISSIVKGIVASIRRGIVGGDGSIAAFAEVAWGDGTVMTWGDGTAVEWSGT